MKYYKIYKITTTQNQKAYIGYTEKSLEARYKQHTSKVNTKHGYYLHKAMQKYGVSTFSIELIEEHTDLIEVRKREKELIELHNTRAPQGYNIHVGGLGGDNLSKHPDNLQIRKHLSESHLKTQKRGSEHPRYIKYSTATIDQVVKAYFSFELPSPIQIIKNCKLSGKDTFNRIIKEQGKKLYRSKIERFEQNPENLTKLYNEYFVGKRTVVEIMKSTTLSDSSITYLLRKHFSSEIPTKKKLHQKHKQVLVICE